MVRLLDLQKRKISILLLSFVFLMGGCSTRNARLMDLSLITDPTGVKATIDGHSCITPCTLTNVDRTAEYVTFEQGAYRQQYILGKKYNPGTMTTVEFVGKKISMPAYMIIGTHYEIQPIDVTFSGSAENPLKTASPGGGTRRLEDVAFESVIKKEQISSLEPEVHPFAVTVGVTRNLGSYDTRLLTSVLRFEKMIGRSSSWYLDVGYADYRSTNGNYRDTAHGLGGEVGMNIYPSGRALKGLYWGFGLGSWNLKGGWKDDTGTPFETTGRGVASVTDINVHVGYKWNFDESRGFFIDPSIALDLMPTSCEPYPFGPAGGTVKAELAIGKRW